MRKPSPTGAYFFPTDVGTFWIRPDPAFPGRVCLGVDEEAIGSYPSPEAAADDFRGRHTGWPAWDSRPDLRAPMDLTGWGHEVRKL